MNLKKTDKIRLDNLAFMFRQEQGVKVTEPVSIHQMLRNKNIIASFQPLSQGFEGMAIKLVNQAKEEKLFMLINTSSNYSRQRFTACHELYHLLYQDNFTVSYDTNDDGEGKEIEEQAADYFARCLLLCQNQSARKIPSAWQRYSSWSRLSVALVHACFIAWKRWALLPTSYIMPIFMMW